MWRTCPQPKLKKSKKNLLFFSAIVESGIQKPLINIIISSDFVLADLQRKVLITSSLKYSGLSKDKI